MAIHGLIIHLVKGPMRASRRAKLRSAAVWSPPVQDRSQSDGYPSKAPHPARPVPILADPLPGVPVRGRNAIKRADACWVPIAPGLTPHGLRHSYKTLMIELGTPATLMDGQVGHADGSVQARYSHVTADMVGRLLDGLTGAWSAALAARGQLHPRSPVAVLDRLLRENAR